MQTKNKNFLLRCYDKLNEILRHLFKPFPVLLAILVSVIEIVDYFTPDPIDRITSQLEEYQRSISQLEIVAIPDSLVTENIEDSRALQQQLIGFAKIINSCRSIASNDSTTVTSQLQRIMSASNASKDAGNLFKMYVLKLGISEPSAMNAMTMFTPELSYLVNIVQEDFHAELLKTLNEINKAPTKEQRLRVATQLLSSSAMQNWIKVNNVFIRQAFEFLNVIQLSMAYNIKFSSINSHE